MRRASTALAGRRRDGRVAQSLIPPTDVRIPYAMETHGVEASLLQSQPTQANFCSVATEVLPPLDVSVFLAESSSVLP